WRSPRAVFANLRAPSRLRALLVGSLPVHDLDEPQHVARFAEDAVHGPGAEGVFLGGREAAALNDDFSRITDRQQPIHELETGTAGHLLIDDDEVEVARIRRDAVPSLITILHTFDFVSGALEEPFHHQ